MLILRLYLHTYLAMVKKTTFNNSDDWEDARFTLHICITNNITNKKV